MDNDSLRARLAEIALEAKEIEKELSTNEFYGYEVHQGKRKPFIKLGGANIYIGNEKQRYTAKRLIERVNRGENLILVGQYLNTNGVLLTRKRGERET